MTFTDYVMILGYSVLAGCAVLAFRAICQQLAYLRLRSRLIKYLIEREES